MRSTRKMRKNEDVCLMMDCQEDELSSAQIDAYERAKQQYEAASHTIEVIMNNSETVLKKGDVTVLYFNNSILPTLNQQNSLTNEFSSINKVTENNIYEHLHSSNIVFNDTHSFSVSPTLTPMHEHVLRTSGSFQTTASNCQLFIVGNSPLNNTFTDVGNISNSYVNLSVQEVPQHKSIPPLLTITSDPSAILENTNNLSCCEKDLIRKHVIPPASEQESVLDERKMFPSLVVVAKPYLVTKTIHLRVMKDEHHYLDEKVKILLKYSVASFTEWLLMQGLIHVEQFCKLHACLENDQAKLKLITRSDSSQFFHNVWVSDCCPRNYIPIFNGSIFEGSTLSSAVLLKLLYHWSTQTNSQNVAQWVKISYVQLKKFYTSLRAVCIAAVHEEFKHFLGGKNILVEVGVISLGTFSQNDKKQIVKMWILGAMECKRKLIRLYAVDNEQKFTKHSMASLEPLIKLVHKESIILTDSTLDISTFLSMGYYNVFQTQYQDKNTKGAIYCNENIMEYLTKCIPQMFHSTLSYLPRQIIQQFLDELVWRERWGQTSLRAFHSIINHIAEQTRLDSGASLVTCLSKIAANPFINWEYSHWKINMKNVSRDHFNKNLNSNKNLVIEPENIKYQSNDFQNLKQTSANNTRVTQTRLTSQPMLPINKKDVASKLENLENYYYGMCPGNKKLLDLDRKCELQIKCVLCNSVLKTNICLMKHIINHALSSNIYSIKDSIYWCKYCLKELTTNNAWLMNKHIVETHFSPKFPTLRCRICEEDFRYRTRLIVHMHCFHTEAEMPYECGICKFRSSEHHRVIDHFYEIHCDGEKAQCPLCLKVVAFKDKGHKITQNIYFFLNHIRKHTYKKLVKKCNKCVLSFVNKGILDYHQRVYHKSCKDVPNLKRYDISNSVLMPTPSGYIADKPLGQKILEPFPKHYTCSELNITINTYKCPENMTCCECEGYFLEDGHFPGYLSCLKCSFRTYCDKTMFEHMIKFHDNAKNIIKEGRPTILEKSMVCICGFESISGNKLANHMIKCGKQTAYPSENRSDIPIIKNEFLINDSDSDCHQKSTDVKNEGFLDNNFNENHEEGGDVSSNMLSALGLVPTRLVANSNKTVKHKLETNRSWTKKRKI